MKIQIIILLLTLTIGCTTEKAPLPELTYFGEEPRVQNPLPPEDSQKHIQLPDGFTAELFAAEPDIINPIAMAWDERGRLWVVQSQDYPHELENDVGGDRITICEDTDGDGRADKFTDYATEQSLSTGIVIVQGGAIVSQAPEMVFLEDTDGDDKMDKRTVLFDGFGIWDTHAGPSSLRYGHDNMIWGAVGYSGFENTFDGKPVNHTMGVYRFSMDGKSFEPVGRFNNNTWGLGISEDNEVFGSTANNNHCCYVGIPLRHYDYLSKRPSWAINSDFIQGHYEITAVDTVPLQQVDVRGGYTAAAGANFYTAGNYPAKYRNQMYVNAPTGHLVHIAKIVKDGAGYTEVDGGNIFASTDSWTAPVFAETGPDGNLWVADWYNPVIQHNPDKRGMDNQIWNADKGNGNAHLNELRDKRHGRIYRVLYKSKSDNSIKSLDPADDKGLIAGLKSDNMFWRTTAQRLIVEHDKTNLVPDLLQLAKSKAKHTVGHALWALDGLSALADETELIDEVLASKDEATLKSAISVIPETDRGSELLLKSELLEAKNLHVRRTAILRASELPESDELFKKMETLRADATNQNDKWLDAALRVYFREQNLEDVDPKDVTMLIPSAEEATTTWKYIVEKPADNWASTDFDDSSWKTGNSMFGSPDLGSQVKTPWKTENIWLRKEVELMDAIAEPVLKVTHDEDYEIYVNGELFFQEEGYFGNYKLIKVDKSPFKKGKNVIAVHCLNTGGYQSIDVGIGKVGDFNADKTMVLNTVSQKMAYDKTELHAMAGQNIEIILNNTDEMPHNLVLIEEGSIDAFGKIVDRFLQSPYAAEKEYVPASRYVMAATKMLDPGEKAVLRIKAPDKPGRYPYVCTFPGHWRLMQGVLVVSATGTYLADDPNALNIINMGGGSSHNFVKFFGEADGSILHQNGSNSVRYTESNEQLVSLLPQADILMISNNKAFDAAAKAAIFSKVNSGMPMMIYHPSLWYNWEDWPAYNKELVGGGSRSHEKLQEFEVIVTKPNHPIMKGVPRRFRITDELYRWKKDPAGTDVEVLAVGKGLESGEEFPVVFIIKHPKTRIIGNSLGHDADAHSLKAYQTILNNSLNWVKRGVKKNI